VLPGLLPIDVFAAPELEGGISEEDLKKLYLIEKVLLALMFQSNLAVKRLEDEA
jgi:hypothetical protein